MKMTQVFLGFVSGMFFGATMLMVTVALVMGVVTTNLFAKKDSGVSPPLWCVSLAKRFFPDFLPPKELESRPCGTHGKNGGCNNRRQSDIMSFTDGLPGPGELDSLTCGCCCHCRGDSESKLSQYEIDRIDAEWRLVSKFSDRCFFWLFVILSGVVQGVLFMHMVPGE